MPMMATKVYSFFIAVWLLYAIYSLGFQEGKRGLQVTTLDKPSLNPLATQTLMRFSE
jgi:hypothetical protein